MTLPAEIETTATACDGTPTRPDDLVSATKVTYNNAGLPVKTETLDPDDGDGYITASTITYDVLGRVAQTTDAAGQATTTTYAPGPGEQGWGLPVQKVTTTNPLGHTTTIRTDRGLGDGVTSIITDHHGTPIAAIPNGGHPHTTPINRLYTDPFGATRGTSDATTVPGDIQFLGKTRDVNGLTMIGARYYDEAVGRFVSVDPLLDMVDPQQWNAFGYANNTPITMSDPTGMRPDDMTGAQWNAYLGGATVEEAMSVGTAPATVDHAADDSSGAVPVHEILGSTPDPIGSDAGCVVVSGYQVGCSPAPPSCGNFSFDACGAGINAGQVTCAVGGLGSVVVALSGSACSIRLRDGSVTYPIGISPSVGLQTKLSAEIGIGIGYTNAQTRQDVDALTWSAEIGYSQGLGGKFASAYGTNSQGEPIYMVVLIGQAGVGGGVSPTGLSVGGGLSCRVGETC